MKGRYRVVFTPVGWQIVDSKISRDPLYEFGSGREEYRRAKQECDRLNAEDRAHSPLWLRGES